MGYGLRLRTRIAPTPSGYLHVGNAWSFVLTWLAARRHQGWIALRIDDLDLGRCRDEYLEDIFASLAWLGLDWDQGPRSAGEFRASFSQHRRSERYLAALADSDRRQHFYACGCSRTDIKRAAGNRAGWYPGTCRSLGLPPGPERTLRYRVPEGERVTARDASGGALALRPDRDLGDFVVRQKNGAAAYQLASVCDDEDARINFVVRGLDLMPSTGAQLSLARALGFSNFPQARFWHHALVRGETGKLSKSAGEAGSAPLPAAALHALRARWSGPAPLLRFFARRIGGDPDRVHDIRDLLPEFRLEKIADLPLPFEEWQRSWESI